MPGVDVLADTSVLHRVGRQRSVAERVAELRRTGRLWTCDIVTMELGYSARNRSEWEQVMAAQARLLQAPLDSRVIARAIEVQGRLTHDGTHRVKLPDLLIAAAAEVAAVGILHYDSDFDLIAGVTGQDADWVAPRETID